MSGGASAQDLPGAGKLLEIAGGEMPPYWAVSNLEIIATSKGEDAAAPRAVIRFEADASPSDPLFVETGQEGPFTIVVPTEGQEATRRLYGVFDLGYRAGNWSGDVEIENPVTNFGQPRDLFDRPTLIQGSEQAATRLSKIRENDIAAAVAAHEAEVTRLQGEHEKAVAMIRASQSQTLQDLDGALTSKVNAKRRENAEALDEARAEGEREVSELRQKYQTQIADLTSDNEPVIAEAKAEREEALAAERENTRAALQTLREEQAAEIETLKSEHAARRGELIETQRQQLAELETRLGTERQSLQRQLEMAEDVITLQSDLVAALDERGDTVQTLLGAFDAEQQRRTAFFARLEKEWFGTVRCDEIEGQGRSWDNTAKIQIDDQRLSDGFTGYITEGDDYERISTSLNQDSPTIPANLTLVVDEDERTPWSNAKSLDMTIDAVGRMVLKSQLNWNIDNVTVPVDCTWRVSANGN
jgi:hypothetical protein